MSKPRIDVIFILDRSGSMASLGTAPATGFNFLSSDLKAVDQAVNLGFQRSKTLKVTPDAAGMQTAYFTASIVADNYARTILDQNLTMSQKGLSSATLTDPLGVLPGGSAGNA